MALVCGAMVASLAFLWWIISPEFGANAAIVGWIVLAALFFVVCDRINDAQEKDRAQVDEVVEE